MTVEEALVGGRWTCGVVKVGDTVRRPASDSSAFVADLLGYVAARGFDGCPRHLGTDDQGRDTFTFIPGVVEQRWRRFDDATISEAATLLRRFHDATAGFLGRVDARGRAGAVDGAGSIAVDGGASRVICHHDPGPNNVVFRDGHPVAFIDFDFAAAGDALEDVAYMAWSWCISAKPERGPVGPQARQVRILSDAYGLDARDRCRLIEAISARLLANVEFWRVAARPRATEMIDWTRGELNYVQAHTAAFAADLT